MMTRFLNKLAGHSPRIILGLDPQRELMPESLREAPDALARFCRIAITAAAPHVDAIKFNLAFFEAEGSAGLAQMEEVLANVPVGLATIGDAKRGDIGSTAEAYARAYLEPSSPVRADAITLNPYLGLDSLEPVAARARRSRW